MVDKGNDIINIGLEKSESEYIKIASEADCVNPPGYEAISYCTKKFGTTLVPSIIEMLFSIIGKISI